MRGPLPPVYPQAVPKAFGSPGHSRPALAPPSQGWLREAFFCHGKPYLGQAVLGEPVCQINVLSPTRRLQ